MIAKYFLICEFLGWIGLIIFAVNLGWLVFYYSRIFIAKTKKISITWLIVNILFIIFQIVSIIMFLITLIDPEKISGLGKLDRDTAIDFVLVSIITIVVSLIDFAINSCCMPYFGAFIRKNKLCISFSEYSKSDFKSTKKYYYYGKNSKWKCINKSSAVGKATEGFLK